MTQLLFQPTTEQTAWEFFEYGMDFGYKQRLFRLKRDPLIAMLAREIPSEALIKGFKLKRKDKEDIDEAEQVTINEVLEIVLRQNDQIIDAISYDRALTHGLLTFSNPSDTETTKNVFIKAYKPENYFYGYDKKTGEYKDARVKVQFVERTGDGHAIKPAKTSDNNLTPFTNKQSIHVATDETDIIGVFEGYIDKIFDDAWGYYITSESATLFIARVGPGVKVYNLAEKDLNTTAKRTAKIKEVKQMSGKGTTIVNVLDRDKESPKSSFDLLTSDSANFAMIVDVFLERVSMVTNIPKSRFKGLEPGQLAAGEINQASYFDVLEKIQFTYNRFYKDAMSIVASNIGSTLDISLYELDWNVRQSLTEIEKADLEAKRIKNFMDLFSIAEAAGMNNEAIQRITGIEYDVDEELIKKAEEKKEEFMNSLNKKTDEGSDNKTDDDDKTKKIDEEE